MSILFSRQCEYALQAVSYLALQPQGRLTSIKELTDRLDIPYHFVGKILQELVQKEILVSRKGHDGGFAFADKPERMTLYKIVEAIDGSAFHHRCVMGFDECSGKHPCAIHTQWEKSRTEIYDLLTRKSIVDLAKKNLKPAFSEQ